ncbi:MAG TPA: hypothetical protein VFQ80_11855 [Thermomicrobiales bacterium]|nr:hypothetical protein [Thermomicrobiales bacterium]
MERTRFDRLARFIGASATRRTATRLTLAAAIAGPDLADFDRSGDAKRRKRCLKAAKPCSLTGRRHCCGAPCGCPTGSTTGCTCRSKTCLAAGQQGCQTDTDCCVGSCVSAGGPGSCLA